MPRINVSGVDIHYRETGQGLPIVFIHGFSGNLRNWALTVPTLARRYRTVSLDLRGHGHSGKPTRRQDYDLDLMADDVHGLLRQLDIGACYLVGHSMGGMVAQHLILRYPQPVRGLVLVDTTAERPEAAWTAERPRLAEIARSQGMEAVFQEQLKLNPTAQGLSPQFIDTWRELFLMTSREAYIYCGLMMDDRRSLLDELAAVAVPTLIVCGENDGMFVGPSKRLQTSIPDSQLVFIPNCGHTPQIEKPQEFNRTLAEFLTRVDATVAARGGVAK